MGSPSEGREDENRHQGHGRCSTSNSNSLSVTDLESGQRTNVEEDIKGGSKVCDVF